MTPIEQYNLQKIIRTAGFIVTAILLIFFSYESLQEQQVSLINLIIFVILLINLGYLIYKKPIPPEAEKPDADIKKS